MNVITPVCKKLYVFSILDQRARVLQMKAQLSQKKSLCSVYLIKTPQQTRRNKYDMTNLLLLSLQVLSSCTYKILGVGFPSSRNLCRVQCIISTVTFVPPGKTELKVWSDAQCPCTITPYTFDFTFFLRLRVMCDLGKMCQRPCRCI